MDRATVLARNANAAYRIYDGQATIVLPDRAEVKVLNETGSLIWDRIDGRRTVGEIIEAVTETFDAAPAQAEKDVLEFIASLQASGMVAKQG